MSLWFKDSAMWPGVRTWLIGGEAAIARPMLARNLRSLRFSGFYHEARITRAEAAWIGYPVKGATGDPFNGCQGEACAQYARRDSIFNGRGNTEDT